MMIFPDQLQVAAEIGLLLLAEIDCKEVDGAALKTSFQLFRTAVVGR